MKNATYKPFETASAEALAQALSRDTKTPVTIEVSDQPYCLTTESGVTLGLPGIPSLGTPEDILPTLRAYMLHEIAEHSYTTWADRDELKPALMQYPVFAKAVNGINDARIDRIQSVRFPGYGVNVRHALNADYAQLCARYDEAEADGGVAVTARVATVLARYLGFSLVSPDEMRARLPKFAPLVDACEPLVYDRPEIHGLEGEDACIEAARRLYQSLTGVDPLGIDEPEDTQPGEGEDTQPGEGEGEPENGEGEGAPTTQGEGECENTQPGASSDTSTGGVQDARDPSDPTDENAENAPQTLGNPEPSPSPSGEAGSAPEGAGGGESTTEGDSPAKSDAPGGDYTTGVGQRVIEDAPGDITPDDWDSQLDAALNAKKGKKPRKDAWKFDLGDNVETWYDTVRRQHITPTIMDTNYYYTTPAEVWQSATRAAKKDGRAKFTNAAYNMRGHLGIEADDIKRAEAALTAMLRPLMVGEGEEVKRGQRSGRLDLRNGTAIMTHRRDIHRKRVEGYEEGAHIVWVVDISGSMNTREIAGAALMAHCLDRACDTLGIDLTVMVYHGAMGVVLDSVNPADSQWDSAKRKSFGFGTWAFMFQNLEQGGTCASQAIQEATKRLLEVDAPRKILMHMTDGLSGMSMGEEAPALATCAYIYEYICAPQGIDVLTFGMAIPPRYFSERAFARAHPNFVPVSPTDVVATTFKAMTKSLNDQRNESRRLHGRV